MAQDLSEDDQARSYREPSVFLLVVKRIDGDSVEDDITEISSKRDNVEKDVAEW